MTPTYDYLVIGAGIVGLATAYQLQQSKPGARIAVIDKEPDVAAHQTGHNSGVIHSGIYYKPGSLKATNCRDGYNALLRFCEEHNIRHEVCGKVIAAIEDKEKAILQGILERGIANGLEGIRKISAIEAREIEPHLRCVEGIWVPQTGIIHYPDVAKKYAEIIAQNGADLLLWQIVTNLIKEGDYTRVTTSRGEYQTKVLINCSGLYADKVAELSGANPGLLILPFRGEYFCLKKEKESLVNNLIYPVPNPNFPFLGVHFTRMAKGGIEAGPNAVLAFRREGYSRWQIHPGELFETLKFPGFRIIAKKYWEEGWEEMKRSYMKSYFVKSLQRLIPEITGDDLIPGGAGVRAQACDRKGNLIDDFMIIESKGVVNVLNAPSPAATASLAIGRHIADKALKQ